METFSWSDTARAAIASCLPCLPSSRGTHSDDEHEHVTRRDELESLLQGAEFTDTDMDADALSLHSHIGQQDGRKRLKKKRKKNKGSITLFGFDLFGRPLPVAEDEERGTHRRISRLSSSTLDSDAAPLADDAIAELSAQTLEQRAAEEARRTRKRLRKQRKAAALIDAHGDSFEGFPGSGAMQEPAAEDFGTFQQAPPQEQEFVHIQGGGPDDADMEADFDAGSYVRSAPPRSDSGSGTRSRTSASSSHPHPHLVPLPPSSSGSSAPAPAPALAPAPKPKHPKKPKSGKRRSATLSSTTLSSTTASYPRSPTSPPAPHVEIASPHDAAFEGVPQDAEVFVRKPRKRGISLGEQELPSLPSRQPDPPSHHSNDFPSTGLGRSGGGFPSSGLGGRGNMGGRGAFLARTGEHA